MTSRFPLQYQDKLGSAEVNVMPQVDQPPSFGGVTSGDSMR